ncbi:unnamed protein product [Urochloa humidicola]
MPAPPGTEPPRPIRAARAGPARAGTASAALQIHRRGPSSALQIRRRRVAEQRNRAPAGDRAKICERAMARPAPGTSRRSSAPEAARGGPWEHKRAGCRGGGVGGLGESSGPPSPTRMEAGTASSSLRRRGSRLAPPLSLSSTGRGCLVPLCHGSSSRGWSTRRGGGCATWRCPARGGAATARRGSRRCAGQVGGRRREGDGSRFSGGEGRPEIWGRERRTCTLQGDVGGAAASGFLGENRYYTGSGCFSVIRCK